MSLFGDLYKSEVKKNLNEKFGYKNINEVPKIEKIVVNMGVGEATVDSKKINSALENLTQITGQKPQLTQAKKSIAGFKLRKGLNIGCKVTLRRNRMYKIRSPELSFVASFRDTTSWQELETPHA